MKLSITPKFMRASNGFNNKLGQSGFGLLSLVMSVGLMGIVFSVFIQWFGNSLSVSKMIQSRNSQEEIRNYLRIRLNCEETAKYVPSSCKTPSSNKGAQQSIALYSYDNQQFVSKSGSQLGTSSFQVKAFCGSKDGAGYGAIRVMVQQNGEKEWIDLYKPELQPNCANSY